MTAVEFLFEMLKDSSKEVFDGNIWEQAIQMEKQQIIDAYDYGSNASLGVSKDSLINETYKNNI